MCGKELLKNSNSHFSAVVKKEKLQIKGGQYMTEKENDHDLLIALNSKVDTILLRYDEMDTIEKRVREIEIKRGGDIENINTMRSEIEKLRNVNTVWSAFNTLGGIILAILLGRQ